MRKSNHFPKRWSAPSLALICAICFAAASVFSLAPAASSFQCGYCVTPASKAFSSASDTGAVSVVAPDGCGWTAESNSSFITITQGSGGTGNGTVRYAIEANPTNAPRTGTITVAGQAVTIMQDAACTPRPAGLVAWWPGDGNPNNIAGPSRATLQTGAAFNSGQVKQAFSFDGTDDFVSTDLDVQPAAIASTTWEAWVFPTRLNHAVRQTILSGDDGGLDRAVTIEPLSSSFGVFTGAGIWQPADVSLNEWQHVAVVYTPTNIEFYKNGVRFSLGSAPFGQASSARLHFGKAPNANDFFKGRIDEVSIYNRALAESEITTIFNAGAGGKCRWIDFADVPQSHIFFREIRSISAQAITLGCDPNNFCPDLVVTRGQMAAFIIRALGMPNPPEPAQQRFADVPPSNPFYRFIEQMAVLGITQGCDADNYCPDDPVLRDQMAAFIIRALGIINPPQPAQQNFIDVPPTNFFFASIEQMRLRGITLGCAAAMYCPSDPVTRSQMAAFLFRGFGQNTNQFPAVFAGQDQTVWLPGAASLSGMINDDGLPDCGALMATWSQVSGPGTVTFSNPNSEATAASFSQPGTYVLRLTAVDSQLSNFDEVTITVNPPDPGNQPPSVNTGPDQAITLPSGASLNATVTDDGNPAGGLSVSWITVSGPGAVIFGNASAPATTAIFSVEGSYVLRLTASDSQLSSFDEVTITVNPDPVPPPPDPMTVAPPIDSSVVTTIGAATEFLYTGPSPIQTGVAPGAIKMERAAVLRGRVIDRNGTPVPKAKISVLNHPEFGQTLSRADGRFDMVVNGGGILTVKYEKVGCLPVQRQADVPWQEYVVVDDVAIVCYDAQVTRLDLSANIPIQVAQGSTVIDEDGRRRATLLFRQGTTATMKLPDGTMQGLTRLHVRATEYTVGERGPEAMPGDLPATSAYTYALEYSVDEAVAAGATQVNFSQPVISYEQNFLGFPTGLSVPTGFYDRESGRWVPSVSGRVVKILSISNGRVNMDLDGSNLPASDAAYAALGITVAERQRLATLFSAGQSLWRTPLSHFSPWDKNWAFGPPADAKPPNTKPPKCDKPTNCPTTRDGSIIGCESQTLGEVVEVTGTPFSLNYNTGRVPGRKASYTLTIPLSDSSIPASVARIDLEVTIAGRKFTQSFPRQTNLTTTFTWDGKDAYGRTMQGAQRAVVRISYVYQGVYQQTNNFGYNGNGVAIFGNPTRQEVLLPTSFVSTVGALDARASGLGGWTLDVHHAYDPIGQVLYLGNGDSRSIDEAPRTISTIAGGVTVDCVVTPHLCQDGVPANRVPLHGPVQIAVDAQGSVYVVENGIPRVRKVTTAGLIFTVAGTGVHGYNGDNIPAVNAQLNIPSGVAVDPMGNVFIGDFNNRRIRKINTAGIITTIAGTGIAADDCADPQNPCPPIPAITANLCGPGALVLDRNGNLYFQDCSRIKKIDPAGNLTTVVFDGAAPAVDTQGNLYYTDFGRTRVVKLSTDNQLTVVAGGNGIGTGGDGGPATQANIECVNHMSFDRQGNLYISQQGCSPGLNRLRVVTPEGFINTFAGLSTMGYGGDGGTARAAGFFHLLNIVEDALGNIYIGDNGGGNVGNIRKVTPFLPSFSANEMVIASEDARELYVFNPAGRHLRTLHALTGATLYEFTYDSAGWLTQVTDGDNNITTIERNGAGNVTGILSPFGQRTALTMDAGGFLASIADPASQTYQFSYTADGLMTGETDPRGNAYSFLYDSLGLLTRDDDPATGFQTLTRSGSIITSYTVTRSTALSRTESFQVQTLATEDLRRVFTDTAGLQTQSIEGKDGTNTDAYPDGMTTVLKLNGDPRWNLMAPLAGNNTITTPGGLAFNSTFARTATLSDPDNLLSLTAQNDTYTVNGRVFTNNYAAASRTFTFTTPAGRQTTTTINPQGRITSSQVADLDPSSFAYDSRGRLAMAVYGTGGAARSFSYAYNAGGFLSSITDPLTRVTSFVYDAAGRVTEQTLPGGRVIAYGYDANGNLTSITPPGRPAHVFNYTPVNLTSSYTPPAVPGTGQTTYAFNLDRQLTTVTRPGGQTLTFSYDSAGRLSTLAVPGGQYNYTYNSTTDNLTSISAPGGQGLSFIYDGSLITQATWAGTVAGSVGYTYDNNFRVTAQNVNGASPINFTYDNDDLLTGAGAMTLTRNAQHGLVTATTLGSVTTTLSYNGYAEAMNHSASFNATGLYACQYTYDKLGRITQKVETVLGSPTTYDYTYDAAGRLASVTLNGAPTPASAYTYDQNGNRTSASIGGVVTNGTYDNQDRLTQYGSTTYAYTANGELLSKSVGAQTTQYVYDVLGNLVAVTLPNGTQIEYVIDGQDLRVGKKVNGALVQGFLYDGQITIVAELDGANNIVSRFVYASRDNVPDFMIKGGVTYRIVSDHLGSPRLVVNAATGAVSQRIDYDEFGNVTLDTNPGFQPFGFAGGLYDRDTGLVRFGARDYDPATGRWTAKDPIMFDGGDTNLYGYVLGDPINLRDLNGLEPLTPSAGIGLPGIDRLFDGGRLDDPIGEEYLEQQQAKIDEVLKSLEDDAKKPESPEEQAKRISDDFASAEKAYRESLKRREASKQSNRDGKDKGKGDKGGRGKGGFCKRKK